MRLRIGGAAAGLALLLTGLAAGAAPRPTVLGVSWEGTGMLALLDAQTLRVVGRRLDIGKPPTGLVARSPDGRTLALGHGSIAELRFVEVPSMRARGRLRLPGPGSVLEGIWPTPNRLIALRRGADPAVLVIDLRAGRVIEQRSIAGTVMGAIAAKERLVAVLAPENAIGPAKLAVVGADGLVGLVVLPGVSAGFTPARNERERTKQASPGIAVDSRGTHATVVTPETLLVVDLARLEITNLHHLKTRAPARVHKLIEGWGRAAIWLRGDTIAVFGWRYSVEGKRVIHSTTGVELVDVTTGQARELDPTAREAKKAGDVLLTFGGSALRGYNLDGTKRFELLRGRDTASVQTSGRWVYVGRDNSTVFSVVDARAGRVVGTARTANPTIVLGPG